MSRTLMFVHTEADRVLYGLFGQSPPRAACDEGSTYSRIEWGLPGRYLDDYSSDAQVARFNSDLHNARVLCSEFDDPIIQSTNGATVRVLRAIANRLSCTLREASEIVKSAALPDTRDPFTATETKAFAVLRYSDDSQKALAAFNNPHHMRRSLAVAVAFNCDDAMSIPVTQLLGYDANVGRRMEPTLPMDWPELPRTAAVVSLEADMRAYVRHVDLAIRCALDSPQEISLTLKNGVELLFSVERKSDSVRGLEVRLSTGGVLFYRDLSAVPGTTNLVYHNRNLPQRKVPFEVLQALARDLHVGTEYQLRVSGSMQHAPPHVRTALGFVGRYRARKAQ